MNPVEKFQVILILMQCVAFVLGMIFERRLEVLRREYEKNQDE